jgi:ABC-type dipeptide/oligopeptide/nickel transport system permease component
MTAQYVRTARPYGCEFFTIVMKHALRNALIALKRRTKTHKDTDNFLVTKQ